MDEESKENRSGEEKRCKENKIVGRESCKENKIVDRESCKENTSVEEAIYEESKSKDASDKDEDKDDAKRRAEEETLKIVRQKEEEEEKIMNYIKEELNKEILQERQLIREKLHNELLQQKNPTFNLNYAYSVINDLALKFKLYWRPRTLRIEFNLNNSFGDELADLIYEYMMRGPRDTMLNLVDVLHNHTIFEYYSAEFATAAFANGYTHEIFIDVIGWIYCLALRIKQLDDRDYLINAVYIIADVLNLFTETGQFDSAGNYSALCSLVHLNLVECKKFPEHPEYMRPPKEQSLLKQLLKRKFQSK